MAKQGLLTDAKVKALKEPGLHGDGGALYLQVSKTGGRSWIYRYYMNGARVPRTMGLGRYPDITLRDARAAHLEAVKLRDAGIDPIDARKNERQIAASNALTVTAACENYLTAQRAKFKTERHVKQMRQRFRDFVDPVIGQMPIADVKGADARLVLAPIWTTKHATATRVRQYMEYVTNWAIHEGVRSDESNPWEEKRLQFAFPLGIHKVKSHASLPFEQAPAFFAELRKQPSVKALALQLVMLCAVRVGDIVGGGKEHSVPMLWGHVDLAAQLWTIPDTKMGRPHVVPLSEPALRLLGEMQRFRDPSTDYVFPGSKRGSCLNDATLRYLLRDMGHGGKVTVHGMRACFRTWASETTTYEKDVVESCLAHAQGALDSAYHRGSYLDKRRRLMAAWASYLEGETVKATGEVVSLRA